LGATSCLISVLKSNEKLLMLIHNSDSDLEHYTRYLRAKTKDGGSSPLLRSSFKHTGFENTIIFYCLDRFEVNFKNNLKDLYFFALFFRSIF